VSRQSFLHRESLPSGRKGFTLIEVLLSLGLAALVLVALATAIDVHLRCLQIGRTNVEEAQLARALLLRIRDDLHNAAVINPVDSTKIPPASSGSTNQSAAGTPGTAGTAGSADTSTATTTTPDTEEDEYAIGLYGETDWMQVDVLRAPRLDQYDYESIPSGSEALPDRVSGIKTVYYALGVDTGLRPTGDIYRGGLMRREIDRALTRWADETGALSSVDQELEPIAPEVTDLEFLYYDGSQWVDSWDSTQMGGLPIAVHVSLAIMPRDEFNRFTATWGRSSAETETTVEFIYSLTVALPVAKGDVSSGEETE
jgi:prepilin-type N-terminal cleavage/methylation domain-containing protein